MVLLRALGFKSWLTSPRAFNHQSRGRWLTVHGENYALSGHDDELGRFEENASELLEAKARG